MKKTTLVPVANPPPVFLVYYADLAFLPIVGLPTCCRSKAVGVSSTPGFTKSMQEIHLDKTVRVEFQDSRF